MGLWGRAALASQKQGAGPDAKPVVKPDAPDDTFRDMAAPTKAPFARLVCLPLSARGPHDASSSRGGGGASCSGLEHASEGFGASTVWSRRFDRRLQTSGCFGASGEQPLPQPLAVRAHGPGFFRSAAGPGRGPRRVRGHALRFAVSSAKTERGSVPRHPRTPPLESGVRAFRRAAAANRTYAGVDAVCHRKPTAACCGWSPLRCSSAQSCQRRRSVWPVFRNWRARPRSGCTCCGRRSAPARASACA